MDGLISAGRAGWTRQLPSGACRGKIAVVTLSIAKMDPEITDDM
jgi:hypothetical protein